MLIDAEQVAAIRVERCDLAIMCIPQPGQISGHQPAAEEAQGWVKARETPHT